MRELRIKQQSSSTYIDFDPVNQHNQLLVVVNEWSSDEMKVSKITVNLTQIKVIHDYLGSFLKEKESDLNEIQSRRKRVRLAFENIYKAAKDVGFITYGDLQKIKNVGIPIFSILAKDLGIPVSEVQQALENTPLPFILFQKHHDSCIKHINEN